MPVVPPHDSIRVVHATAAIDLSSTKGLDGLGPYVELAARGFTPEQHHPLQGFPSRTMALVAPNKHGVMLLAATTPTIGALKASLHLSLLQERLLDNLVAHDPKHDTIPVRNFGFSTSVCSTALVAQPVKVATSVFTTALRAAIADLSSHRNDVDINLFITACGGMHGITLPMFEQIIRQFSVVSHSTTRLRVDFDEYREEVPVYNPCFSIGGRMDAVPHMDAAAMMDDVQINTVFSDALVVCTLWVSCDQMKSAANPSTQNFVTRTGRQ